MQEAHVRKWVQDRVDFETPFRICFYTGSYSDTFCSIMPVGDLTDIIPDEEVSWAETLRGLSYTVPAAKQGACGAMSDCGRLQASMAALCCVPHRVP